jgi:RHS repeat-associated protein
MKQFYYLLLLFAFCAEALNSQEFDVTYVSSESGTKTHLARNSITLGPGYVYSPSGGTLLIGIQNPVVTGPVSYGTIVDPETRSLSTSYMVGAINGSVNVDALGGASYSIPLNLPVGVNGLKPDISLVYSSNSGPGLAGYGWKITGLSAISRGPKTFYNDGMAKGIDLDTTDRFYIDGQRLVNTLYTYGHASAQYQTELDVFTRLTPKTTTSSGPGWFLAETKSGLKIEYGNTEASKQRINGYSAIVSWYASKISDLYGNQINFAYIQDNYNVYPVEITYGPNTVTFYYKESTDKNFFYLKGTKIQQNLIIDKITIKYNSAVVRTYELKYNHTGSQYNYHSLLNEVIEYGIGNARINSTAISYQIPDNVNFEEAVNSPTNQFISYQAKIAFGDFDGDGLKDAFCVPDAGKGAMWTGWRILKNNGGDSFTHWISGSLPIEETLIDAVEATDLNGDNIDDLIITKAYPRSMNWEYHDPCYYYSISNGSSLSDFVMFARIEKSNYFIDPLKRTADFDGDGLNDCFIINTTGDWKIFSGSYTNGTFNTLSLKYSGNIGYTLSPTDRITVSEFNGDGRTDVWISNYAGIKIFTLNGSTLQQNYSSNSPDKGHFYSIGDFNADGKGDILLYGYTSGGVGYDMYEWQIKLSTGIGFETLPVLHKKLNLKDDILRPGDFNGDGATDYLVTSSMKPADGGWTGHYYYISSDRGTNFSAHFIDAPIVPEYSNKYYIEDFDGDGRQDFLSTDGAEPWQVGYKIFRTDGNNQIIAKKIGNGLGQLIEFDYSRLTQNYPGLYARGTGATFPVSDYQGPLRVICRLGIDNMTGTMRNFYYHYEGLKVHLQGKGILGYAKIKVEDDETGIISENVSAYDPTYFYPQLVSSQKKLSGQDDPFETFTNTWSQKVLNNSQKRIFPYINSSTQTNLLTGHSITTTADYDNYGNPTSITKCYSSGPTESTVQTYSNIVSSTQWLIGRPITTTLTFTENANVITRSAIRVFNSEKNNLERETWHSGTNLESRTDLTYFPNGNLQKQKITDVYRNISRETQYTFNTDNTRVASVTDPMQHVTTNTYDTYGRLSTQQDYLTTNTVTYGYDNLHRQISISRNDGSGTSTVYAWENPLSTPLQARYSILTSGTDGAQTKVWYDRLGQEIRTDVKSFNGTMIYTCKEYDTKGQITRISDPYFPTETPVWNNCTYDEYGRKTSVNTPSGQNSSWVYEGNTITETTAGKSFSKTFASNGSLTSASDNGGIINYTYFPDGALNEITAPGGIITSMHYDLAGNQNQLIDPSAGNITYSYNAFGELLTQTNGRSQATTLTYFPDGRPNQRILSAEGITFTYTYNGNKQLTSVTSTSGVERSFGYDPKGRVTTTTETISGSSPFITNFTYDGLGRLKTTEHVTSGITETNNYNNYGYLSSVEAGGAVRWTILGTNSRGQITAGKYGSDLNTSYGYNSYGYPTSVTTGTLQSYQYDFNSVTGNLNWRKNLLASKEENFDYDALDRLDRVYRGTTTLLDMAYDQDIGSITTKSDVGILQYESSTKPYTLTGINPSTGLTPGNAQSISYTSFESINSITEGNYSASFVYNSDDERARMTVLNNGSTELTRWYPNGSLIKESSGATSRLYTFIGGDAYSAPVVAIKQDNGANVYYYLLRDHLGSITHVINASDNSLAAQYSYDAWGRMRNPSTWENYAPGQEPTLMIAGRGYTGHEHLPWFKLINMNGRVYDPLTGQFLSPDNYVQMPDYSQGFNRYAYALNNPLKYSDPDGEWLQWLLCGIIGGVTNVIANWDNINGDIVKFNQYLAVGIVAGSTGAVLAESGAGSAVVGMASGWLFNTGNAYIRGARGNDLIEPGVTGALAGGLSGLAMEGISAGINGLMKIPWTTNYHREGGGRLEVSLGECLFGTQNSMIGDLIADQGIANAEVMLATNTLSTTIKVYYNSIAALHGSDGAELTLFINGDYDMYNFVQTVYSSDYRNPYFLDGDGSDDGRGFFRAQEHLFKYEGFKAGFFDRSRHPMNQSMTWQAELTIVGKYGGTWHPITSISWGYSINYGNAKMSKLEIAKKTSQFHKNWVKRACNNHSLINL